MNDGWKIYGARLSQMLITAGICVVIFLGAVQLFYGGAQRQEQSVQAAILEAQVEAAEATEALICTLSAPLRMVSEGSVRDEGFINAVCLSPHDIEPFDVDGDGKISLRFNNP